MKIAAIIPCYRVREHIVAVVADVLEHVHHVFVVDDRCPEGTGDLVAREFPADKVSVIRHTENKGVGGATVTGYVAALARDYEILIKVDGDGQMDPALIPDLVAPILAGKADYTKGNRFYRRDYLKQMPGVRLIGNSMLSLVTKASSGYWNIMDPTNGFTALHSIAAQELEMDKLARRYFFESDVLFRLNISRAVVRDVPMPASYGDEKSNLKIGRVLFDFPVRHIKNLFKRFLYNYIIRDFSAATIETLLGGAMFVFGVVFGTASWIESTVTERGTPVGTVMLATLPIILGFQLLIAALSFDVSSVPSEPLQTILGKQKRRDQA
jgi:dolichol-phosphate mannosyltransferase